MKKIKTFVIDSSALTTSGGARTYTVGADPRSAFSMVVINKSGEFYNFPENTTISPEEDVFKPSGAFSSTPVRLSTKTVGNSGFYTGIINFPTVSEDDKYTIVLQAESYLKTEFADDLSLNSVYHAAEVEQFHDTTVSFAVASTGTTYANETSDDEAAARYTAVGPSTSVTKQTFNNTISLSWAVALSSSQFIIARQPVIGDFYFTTTKDTFSVKSGKILELKNVSGLSKGMAVSGTGINTSSTIVDVTLGYKNENKSIATKSVYTIPKDIDTVNKSVTDSKGGTVTLSHDTTSQAIDRTITFKGFGSENANAFNNTVFTIKNFKLTIAPVVTTTDAAVSNNETIPITSTNGIKAADTILMSGVGVTAALPHVDIVNNNVSVVVSTNQTIENGQTVTFTGSSRSATITADIIVEKYGKDNLVLILELDNILTVG